MVVLLNLLRSLRELLVYRLCGLGYKPCIYEARRLFAQARAACEHALFSSSCNPSVIRYIEAYGNPRIPPSLRHSTYVAAIEFGEFDDWRFLSEKHALEEYDVERDRLYQGLASTKNVSVISRCILFDLPQLQAH